MERRGLSIYEYTGQTAPMQSELCALSIRKDSTLCLPTDRIDANELGTQRITTERRRKEMKSSLKIGISRRFFNFNLKKAIEKSGLTATDIKKKCRINETILSQIINFKRYPHENHRILLAIVLNVPIDDIFPEEFDIAYDKLRPLSRKTDISFEHLELNSAEVLQLESPITVDDLGEAISSKMLYEKGRKQLTPREQKILHLRFFEKQTQEEIGRKSGVTSERIKQIEKKAIKKLQKFYSKIYE